MERNKMLMAALWLVVIAACGVMIGKNFSATPAPAPAPAAETAP